MRTVLHTPLTPTELPAGGEWWRGCGECRIPVQGGAYLAAHCRTVHDPHRDYADLALAREEIRRLRGERDQLQQTVRRHLGQLGARELATRVQELTEANTRLEANLHEVTVAKSRLERHVTDTQCGCEIPAELIVDEEGFAMTHEEFVNLQVGSRRVGGRYRVGANGEEYEVVEIDRGPRGTWPSWQITVRWQSDGRETTHCTGWDDRRDSIVSFPAASREVSC
ncbi:hypothetical protein [Streptomyces sp. NPDC056194]|uniref:hypothetical protein n=1 Tax=unclassified Streptomyces TaxID=2593676 RepID=UPI0035DC6A85